MPTVRPSFLQAAVSAVLIAQLVAPAVMLAQEGMQTGMQQQKPMQQSQAQANEQTSTPIQQPDVAPMTTVQAVLPKNASPLTQDEILLQVLNRFTYGPRPGDLERLRAQGISKWLTDQLNPQNIDDSALTRRLADYPAMQLPLGRLMEQYPNNQMIRAAAAGRVMVPRGEGERAIYDAQMERYDQKKKKGADRAEAKLSDPDPLPQDPQTLIALDPEARFKAMTKLSPAQLGLLRQKTPQDDREKLTAGFTPHQMEVLAAVNGPAVVVAQELIQTKLLRDVYSERQLNEIMTDFWLNHFNVYVKKSQDAPYYLTAYERDTIRPRALGNFENLLVATAISPAMLNYLDNASSIGPDSDEAKPLMTSGFGRFPRRQPKKAASGLNENYARELMELHTLGVNGGYTQKDVTEVAKVFTGWTIGRGRDGGVPVHPEFDASKHQPGDKFVLGQKIKMDGSGEGLKVLHILANSPQTAHFVCTKLAVRFVSDDTPPALVDAMAATFLSTHGDIRHVLLTMVSSPQFFTRDTYRAKVKTPQDYVLSAVRASGAEVVSAGALAATISDLGMPVYGMQTPNGYSMRADPWNNTAALVSRMNFALALSSNRLPGVHADLPALISANDATTPEAKDQALESHILHTQVSDRTRQTILTQITADPAQQQASLRQISAGQAPKRDPLNAMRANRNPPANITDTQTALAAGLIFGSPEFQRR